MKGRNQNYILYQPLPIPSRPRDVLIMDFVLGLSRTQRVHDIILLVVKIFSKMDHFISNFKTSDETHVANLFFKEIVRFHGLPRTFASNRDTTFVGYFWTNLWKRMGKKIVLAQPITHREMNRMKPRIGAWEIL